MLMNIDSMRHRNMNVNMPDCILRVIIGLLRVTYYLLFAVFCFNSVQHFPNLLLVKWAT